jgi:hypothetical protein
MNPGDYSTLNNDIVGTEQVRIQPNGNFNLSTDIRSSFPNINIAGVPIFADYFCPVGNAFALNTKYTSLFISEDAALDWSGFHSLVPLGQIGQQGIMALGYNVASAKSSSGAWVYGFGGAAF